MKKLVIPLTIALFLMGCSPVLSLKDQNQKSKPSEIDVSSNEQPLPSQMNDRDKVLKEVNEFLSGELTKVVISKGINDPSPIEITDRSILDAFPHLLNMNHLLEYEPFPGGIRADETPCNYRVYSGGKILSFEILADGIVSLNKENNAYYFQSGYDTYHLGKAFLSKPVDIPDEPVMAKMYHSGLLMSYENSEKAIAYLSKFRIQGTVKAFISIKKQEISRPRGVLILDNRLVFYYFGNKIELNGYDQYIQIVDNTNEYWYSVPKPGLRSVFDFLRAG